MALLCLKPISGTGKRGHFERGLFTGGISRISKSSLSSLESLENGRILLCVPRSGGFLEFLKSLNSLESLENGLFCKDPFSKRPLFLNPRSMTFRGRGCEKPQRSVKSTLNVGPEEQCLLNKTRETEKGVITKGVFSLEKSL